MYVRPIELANVCAVFPSQKTGRLPTEHLTKLVQYSRLMDCEVPTSDIIKESVEAGLLSYKSGFYYLTSKGKKITKTHIKPTHRLSDQTAEAFIKTVLLQESSASWCCREFILELKVAPDDVGKVIGKGGQTAKALRKILSAAATKLHKKSLLQIIE